MGERIIGETVNNVGAALRETATLTAAAHEGFNDGPQEWLLDYQLPSLFVAIWRLYAQLGETHRLKNGFPPGVFMPAGAPDSNAMPAVAAPEQNATLTPSGTEQPL